MSSLFPGEGYRRKPFTLWCRIILLSILICLMPHGWPGEGMGTAGIDWYIICNHNTNLRNRANETERMSHLVKTLLILTC